MAKGEPGQHNPGQPVSTQMRGTILRAVDEALEVSPDRDGAAAGGGKTLGEQQSDCGHVLCGSTSFSCPTNLVKTNSGDCVECRLARAD